MTLILIFGGITGVVSEFVDYLIFAIEIVVIYGIVKFIIYQSDISTAKTINEKLKNLREPDE
jgi:preprotein translocase subunit YajC